MPLQKPFEATADPLIIGSPTHGRRIRVRWLAAVACPIAPLTRAAHPRRSLAVVVSPPAGCVLPVVRHPGLALPAVWRHAVWRHARWRHARWRHARWRHARWRHSPVGCGNGPVIAGSLPQPTGPGGEWGRVGSGAGNSRPLRRTGIATWSLRGDVGCGVRTCRRPRPEAGVSRSIRR